MDNMPKLFFREDQVDQESSDGDHDMKHKDHEISRQSEDVASEPMIFTNSFRSTGNGSWVKVSEMFHNVIS